MKVGVFSFVFQALLSYEKALDWIAGVGAQAVEVGSGGYVAELGESYCKPAELLADEKKLTEWAKKAADRGLEVSALSCHGNPLHPNPAIAERHRQDFRDTVQVAEKIGVRRVVTFSGCPGDSDDSKYPNWVTCPWPPDFLRILEWQWNEKVIPYWQDEVKFCRDHGVDMISLEMHPGFVVYNPETLLRLRNAVGPEIGANFDPSHLFWQNIDPLAAIRALGPAIFHVHAKDTIIDPFNTPVNGVLDTKPYANEINRSWIFRTVGYGHDVKFWKDLVSTLRLVGYDYVLSMEHEDSLMSLREGLEKGVGFLRELILTDERGKPWFEA
ncbi:MAG: sugar phosphate isomerase/epimerase [Anaerolineae bacterium]|nr:sugar phosphate isomerase/epimerase [Anaerolineae bacterium]